MPPVGAIAAAIAGLAIGQFAAPIIAGLIGVSTTATVIGSITVGKLISTIVGSIVTFGLTAVMQPRASSRQPSSMAALNAPGGGRTIQFREPIVAHRLVVGRARVSGPIVFVHVASEGNKPNTLLYMVHALAAHRLAGVQLVRLDRSQFDDPRFLGNARAEWMLGSSSQPAINMLVAETDGKWTTAHRARGRAVLATRLRWDEKVWRAGVPNVSAIVRGAADVFDPRTGAVGYTRNPALLLAWYLTGPYCPHPISYDDIDTAALIAAANVCDESVPLRGGGTEPRYTADGVLSSDEDMATIINRFCAAMAGSCVVIAGVWHIHAGAWRAPTYTITSADLRGGVSLRRNRAQRDLFNSVRAVFVRPDADWQPSDAPPVIDQAAVAADGGIQIWQDLDLPLTTSAATAQRLMRIALRRNRLGRQLTLECNLRALAVKPGDVVAVDLPRIRPSTWRCVAWSLGENALGIDVTLEEETPDIYAWNAETDEQPLPPVPDVEAAPVFGDIVAPTTLTATPPATPVPTTIDVSWSAVSGAASYDVEWIAPSASTWSAPINVTGTSATVTTNGRAAFRVRAVTADARVSAWRFATFPPALTAANATAITDGFYLTWSGAQRVQVFVGTTSTFSAATKTSEDGYDGAASFTGYSGTIHVWLRAVHESGVVGHEAGPIVVNIAEPGSGGGWHSGGEGSEGGAAEGGMGSAGDP